MLYILDILGSKIPKRTQHKATALVSVAVLPGMTLDEFEDSLIHVAG